jgi:hypothetical protein
VKYERDVDRHARNHFGQRTFQMRGKVPRLPHQGHKQISTDSAERSEAALQESTPAYFFSESRHTPNHQVVEKFVREGSRMYAISDKREQDWRDKEDCGPTPGGAEEGNGPPARRRHDPEYNQRSNSRTPGQIFDFLGKRKGLPTACVDIAPPEKWPGERTGKYVENNNRAPVESGLSAAAVHIDRSLSRRF